MDNTSDILERLIGVTNFRHKVLASNVSNVDTPGYRAKDINFKDIINRETLKLSATNKNHINLVSVNNSANREIVMETTPTWDDRNNVELDMEVAKMTENAILNQTSIKLLSTRMKMFRNALRGR